MTGRAWTAEDAADVYANAKAAGYTCEASPQKYRKRGTGPTLRTRRDSNPLDSNHVPLSHLDVILFCPLSAGVKAL